MGGDKMNFDNIPEELKKLDRWVCWRWEEKFKKDGSPDKPAKVPMNPNSVGRAMTSNPATWATFYDAVEGVTKYGYPGIGFVFNGDGVVGVDIDHCRDPETGVITTEAKNIISTLDSYTEFSQSGNGIHIIVYGKMPEGSMKRKGPFEIYETGRYFIMTGNILDDVHADIENRNDELQSVCKKYLFENKTAKNVAKTSKIVNDVPVFANDDEIIEIALAAKNRGLFEDLMNGSWQGRYGSQSEADLALCNLLAFYAGRDPGIMDRLFRRSGLMRPKWDENHGEEGTYGRITIGKAIADCDQIYEPKKKKGEKKKAQVPPEIDSGLDQLVGPEKGKDLPDWITGPYHDTWNAQRFVDKYGTDIKYNTNKGWHVWNGKYWEEDRQGKVRRMADDTIARLYDYSDIILKKFGYESRKNKEFLGWLSKARNTGRKDNMIKEAQSWEGIATLPEEFDKDLWVLNCNNWTIDLRTSRQLPHNQKDLITRIVPVDHNKNAKAPIWDKFLDRIFDGNKELTEFLQRAVGYSLTGSIREQCMFILHGVGRNGKSTFLDTIRAMLGGYTRNANASTFMRTENSNLNEIARLQGARFVTTTELEEGERLSESLIKQATGGEPLTARYLYKEAFEYIPEFKLWMGTNHKPKITGGDLGIWRRIRLVPFNVIIPPEEQDGDLPNKLLKELPGIMNWALEGCAMWQKDGLKAPKEVLSATDDYRGEMDSLQVFIDECIEFKEEASVKSGELYRVFENWCEKNGEYKHSSTKFALKLKEKGIQKGRTRLMRIWDGIQLSLFGRKLLFTGTSESNNDKYEQEEFPWER
jgi:putative DNA primase/helicase